MAKKTKDHINTEQEDNLLALVWTRYKASYEHKQSLGLMEHWALCHEYWAGEINFPEDDDDPGSEVNIIQPIIESQVADIVNGETDILVKGLGPSDQPFAKDVCQILKWVWRHNNMINKLDQAERDRLNFGSVIWKVMWDKDAISGRGMPIMIPLSPDCFFPDPKVTDVEFLQDADYMIQTGYFSRRKLIELFGDIAKEVDEESFGQSYDPRVFNEDDASSNEVLSDQACVYEYWERKDDGKLRLVYCTRDIILADSDNKDPEGRAEIPDNNKYPFVMILGYKRKGRLWGMGDTEQLIPVQDNINDLDDQIRLNARMTGNAQVVYNSSAGINAKKWTNTPGLKIPAKDHKGFQVVQPPYMPAYIPQRREKAFYESELVSGRSEVVEGRRSGSLRAASAILALQEAGSRRSNHKKLMLQTGMTQVQDLVLDYVREFMDTEQAFDIIEKDHVDYLWFRGTDLNAVPELTLNENFNRESDDPLKARYKPLFEESVVDEGTGETKPGGMMTKIAEFDIEIHLGAGMPNNKSFIYEATIELLREGAITQEEARATLKDVLNWPIINPWEPEGTFVARNASPEQLGALNGVVTPPGGTQQPTPQPEATTPPVQIDPAMVQNLVIAVKSGQINEAQLTEILNSMPPEALPQILAILQSGMIQGLPQQAPQGTSMGGPLL